MEELFINCNIRYVINGQKTELKCWVFTEGKLDAVSVRLQN